MSVERTNNGNGYSEPLTNEEWLAFGGLETLAKEVVRATNLTERVVDLVESLGERVAQLETPQVGVKEAVDPLPEDFEIDLTDEVGAAADDELTLTDKGKEVLAESTEQVDEIVEEAQPASVSQHSKTTIQQASLLQALKVVMKAVPRHSVNQIFSNLKLAITADKLTLTASDGDTWMQQSVPADTEGERELLIPAKLLLDTVKGLPKVELQLNFDDDVLWIADGGANCTIGIQSAEDYPELPRYSDRLLTALSTSTLKSLLRMTSFASVNESSTGAVHYTNGVLLSLDGNQLDVVATDGHRLVLAKHRGLGSAKAKGRMLIPTMVAGYLEQLLPDDELAVSVYLQGEQVFFEVPPHSTGKRVIKRHPATLIGCRMVDVKFPEYERIVPKSYESKVHVNREQFSAALKRCLMVCKTKDTNPVAHFETVKGMMTITADGGETSQAKEELACEGGIIKTSLNPQYLLDVLRVLSGDDVILNWQSEVEPMAVTSPRHPDFIYIVMPIRMD